MVTLQGRDQATASVRSQAMGLSNAAEVSVGMLKGHCTRTLHVHIQEDPQEEG